MKKAMVIIVVLLTAFIRSVSAFAQVGDTLMLTDTEKEYIASKGPIKIVVDPDWYPYERIDKNGKYVGISSDLVALITQRTGLKFEIIPTSKWTESLEKAKSGQADVVSFLNKTEERSQWLLFTDSYFVDPNVLITREEHDFISNHSKYVNETMVLPEGTSMEERLRKDYPYLKIIIVNSEEDAIKYIEEKKADFTLRSLTMAAYIIKNDGHFNLKIAGEIPDYHNQFRLGITKQDKILQGILNKGIATLSEQDIQDALNHYISIKIMKGFDYKLFFIIFGVFSLILISTLYWLRRIQGLNKQLEIGEKKYRMIAEELEAKNVLLEASVTTDVLTGLKNRLYFNQRVTEGIESFTRYGTKLSLLILDIDHFKRINDTYGHAVGDEVLKRISCKLQNKLRKVDLLARWGGEEFIALLPETEIEEATGIAEKLRKEAEALIHENSEVITISIGVSMLLESETLESWIKRTDRALYHAKKQGRNRYCVSNNASERSAIELFQWNPSWNSGHTGIDQQHFELFTLLNELMNNVLQGDNNYSISPELEKLMLHIKKHFIYEEELLYQQGYSDVIIHKKLHDELTTKAENLIRRSEEGYLLPIDVALFIVEDTIIMHLLKEDTKFFDLLKSRV